MGLRAAVARVAGSGPVPTFVIPGCGGRRTVEDLRLEDGLLLLDSPRAATVLLIVGALTDRLLPAAMLTHDQMPRPRATIQWLPGGGDDPLMELFPSPVMVGPESDPVEAAHRTHRELLSGDRSSDPPIYPDVAPTPWRGVGPYRQGGKGMSGGTPYGRPLAGRAPDRDGLELDQLPLDIGPLFPPFPPGLILSIRLQGDVVQEVTGWENALSGGAAEPEEDPFRRAIGEPVRVAELEVARARHHLRWLSRTLRLHGLPAAGLRVLALARRVEPRDAESVEALRRRLERSRSLAWATAGTAPVPPETLGRAPGGPVARAGGIARDARADDPVYRDLGFEPVVHDHGDARARWRQRLAEAAQALELAGRAGDRVSTPTGIVESASGELRTGTAPAEEHLSLLPDLLPGLEWGEAVSLVHDLDVDMEEVAAGARESV